MIRASLRGAPSASSCAATRRNLASSWRRALTSPNSFVEAYARRNCFLNRSGVQSHAWSTVIGGGGFGNGSTRTNSRQFLLVKAAEEKFLRQIIGPKLKSLSRSQQSLSI